MRGSEVRVHGEDCMAETEAIWVSDNRRVLYEYLPLDFTRERAKSDFAPRLFYVFCHFAPKSVSTIHPTPNCGAFSWLMTDVDGRAQPPVRSATMGRWSWMIGGGWASHEEKASRQGSSSLCFSFHMRDPALNSLHEDCDWDG